MWQQMGAHDRQDVLETIGLLESAPALQEDVLDPYMRGLARAGAPLRETVAIIGRLHNFQMPFALYANHHQLIADRGSEWSGNQVVLARDIPELSKWRQKAECYQSALALVAQSDGYKYVEGWIRAYRNGTVGHLMHGWVTDPASGLAIEAHFKETDNIEYLGVIFEPEQIVEHMATTGYSGMFASDDRAGYDLLIRGCLGRDYTSKGG